MRQIAPANIASLQLHVNQEHPDASLLEHTRELIAKLESFGIQPSPQKDGDDEEETLRHKSVVPPMGNTDHILTRTSLTLSVGVTGIAAYL